MTEKQERFCIEYLVDQNATAAAIRAGYSAQTARAKGCTLKNTPEIMKKIREKMGEIEKEKILTAEENMLYLSNVIRGVELDEKLVSNQLGEIEKKAVRSQANQIKATEMLRRWYEMLNNGKEENENERVIIIDDLEE